jgi:hypothetical protein
MPMLWADGQSQKATGSLKLVARNTARRHSEIWLRLTLHVARTCQCAPLSAAAGKARVSNNQHHHECLHRLEQPQKHVGGCPWLI